MRSAFLAFGLIGTALALPRPQEIDLDGVAAAADPVIITPPYDVASNLPSILTTTSVAPIATDGPDSRKRSDIVVEKRDGTCAPLPTGSGPVPSPDTVAAFQSDPDLQALATNAPTPYGYASVFTNLAASVNAPNYMGLHTVTSFDTLGCANLCDRASGCTAFNIYIERDPSVSPNSINCPNPPSVTNFKCTLYGTPLTSDEAKNTGQYRDSFQIVIVGSNAYNKNTPPPAISGFTGPVELGGAINAPNSYMGYQFFPFSQTQGFDPTTCASACTAQTTYDENHPNPDCSYQPCIFFNAYVLSEDGIPQGLYCSMYNATWAPSYGTNYGQYRGSDRYTVSDSYSYSLMSPPSQPALSPGCTPSAS
ncbi:hypothetical protein MMC11_008160 [Xylographa trunciseda]|nr:hypothetical protein [Xylographa trunciseda]